MTTAVIFPGQGSQKRGMGGDLFARYPDWVEIARKAIDFDPVLLCRENPEGMLDRTEWTQPAIFLVNALWYRAWRETHPDPDVLAGHSLGEYNALLAAGCFDFEQGMAMVVQRGRLMGRAKEGSMSAVIGMDQAHLATVLAEHLPGLDLANINTDVQVVLSGPKGLLEQAEGILEGPGVRIIPLRVGGAFHSRLMAGAAAEFGEFLSGFELSDPRIPVVANVTASEIDGPVGDLLRRQIDSSVRWRDSVVRILERGVDEFVEASGSRILTAMVDSIRGSWARADKPASKLELIADADDRMPGRRGCCPPGGIAWIQSTLGRDLADLSAEWAGTSRPDGIAIHPDRCAPGMEDALCEFVRTYRCGWVEISGFWRPTDALRRLRRDMREWKGRMVVKTPFWDDVDLFLEVDAAEGSFADILLLDVAREGFDPRLDRWTALTRMVEAGEAAVRRHGWKVSPRFGLAGGIRDAATLATARSHGATAGGIGSLLLPVGEVGTSLDFPDPLHAHLGGRIQGFPRGDGRWEVVDHDAAAFRSWAESAGRSPAEAVASLCLGLAAA